MNKRAVSCILGLLILIFAGFMALPLLIAFRDDPSSSESMGLGLGVMACLLVGGALYLGFRKDITSNTLGTREGLAITALGWILLAAFGAIPFTAAHPEFISFTEAYFEVMSGLTTTGSTILTASELDQEMGVGLLFWRSFTHWIGGMGIILLTVAILPLFGAGGYQLFRAEVPGPTKDRLQPRIIETAKTLWKIYLGITILEVLLLWGCGMTLFESLCHTFGTVATGGFSTKSGSIGQFSSLPPQGVGPVRGWLLESVVVVFMFLAGCNFIALYRAVQARSLKPLWRSTEFRFYLTITILATLFIGLILWGQMPTDKALELYQSEAKGYDTGEAFRAGLFNTVTILTTTGYGTEDFDVWPTSIRLILLLLMFFGGCAGSTAGGIKMMRVMILGKFAWQQLLKTIRPRAVFLIKHEGRAVEPEVVSSLLGFFVLYMGSLALGTLLMTLILPAHPPITGADGPEGNLSSAFTACLATLSNIGPGLSGVGPSLNFSEIPGLGKWLLSLLMLMGRLELLTVLALLSPHTWRK